MVALLAMVLVICSVDLVQACPTCKNSVAGQAHLVRGYFWSIIFMMSMPFVLLTSFSMYFYYLIRKSRVAEASDGHIAFHSMPVVNPMPES